MKPQEGTERVVIGRIAVEVIEALGLAIEAGEPIYIGESNIAHMQTRHCDDYAKYGGDISEIVKRPDYVGMNPNDGSIEYVKEYIVEGEYVKVAVRVAQSGRYYARSLYVLNPARVNNFIRKGTLKPLTWND